MIQTRHRIFETNSSTTHSLTITINSVTPEVIEQFKKEHGTHIVFGKNSYDTIYDIVYKDPAIDENTSFQIKADILYFSMYVWTEGTNVAEFLYNKKALTDRLQEMGFTVEFREDPQVIENYDWHKYDIDENLFENLWRGDYIEEVIDFLFNPHTLYFRWCDECCAECPKAIIEAEDRFIEYHKTEEQKTYSYR